MTLRNPSRPRLLARVIYGLTTILNGAADVPRAIKQKDIRWLGVAQSTSSPAGVKPGTLDLKGTLRLAWKAHPPCRSVAFSHSSPAKKWCGSGPVYEFI